MNKVQKGSYNYECKDCDYHTSRESQYNRHLSTTKHKLRTNGTNRTDLVHNNKFECECGKIYTARNSFWYHKQKCKGIKQEETRLAPSDPPVDSSLIIELLKQNQVFKEMVIEHHKRMTEQQDTIIELSNIIETQQTIIIDLNNFTQNKHKKEMATKIENGHL